MDNRKINIPTVIVSVLAACLFSWFLARQVSSSGAPGAGTATSVSTAYERVMRTNTIRAGYVAYPPQSIVTPGTKEVSGIFPDLLREIGRSTDLKVEFVEEAGWATLIEGLETGRYDVIGGFWANPERGKMATISVPVFYSGIGVWTRPDEKRFSSKDNWSDINDQSVRIAAIDGSSPLKIAKDQFPKAKIVSYPNLTNESQLFLDLVHGKVDVFFAEPTQGLLFLKSNPGAIRNQAVGKPLRMYPNIFLMRRNEPQLKTLLDTSIGELEGSGKVDEIITKYEPAPGSFYRKAPSFVVPSNN